MTDYSRDTRRGGGLVTQRTETRRRSIGAGITQENSENVYMRAIWLAASWGPVRQGLLEGSLEVDLHRVFTARVAAAAGFVQWDGRNAFVYGEAAIWLHTHRLQRTTEIFVMSFETDSEQTYNPNTGRYYTSRSTARETDVRVPGIRLQMQGVMLGAFFMHGQARTREETGNQWGRASALSFYAGYSRAWVKSSRFYIQGYGHRGKSRYHRMYFDLFYAPFISYRDLTVDRSSQDPAVPLGLRLGVENLFGRRAAFTMKAEIVAFPAQMGGMARLSVGFGSLLAR